MLALTGLGMVTSLGYDAVASCAAARAGIVRVSEVDDLYVEDANGDESAAVAVHRAPSITAGLFGYARLLQLGQFGLTDLSSAVAISGQGRTGIILVVGNGGYRAAWFRRLREALERGDDGAGVDENELDEAMARFDSVNAHIGRQLLRTLVQRLALPIEANASMTLSATAVGFIPAIRQAEDWLESGRCERCIVGGVESLVEPATLAALDGLGLLKTSTRSQGMIPGEAAGFILVESMKSTIAASSSIGTLEATAMARGAAHPGIDARPSSLASVAQSSASVALAGASVAEAIAGALEPLHDHGRDVALTLVNLNGDAYRANRWWVGLLRSGMAATLKDLPVWYPPVHFGEIGAATGPVSIAMVLRGWARGYARNSRALVCLMDDNGGCGTVCVRAPEGTK